MKINTKYSTLLGLSIIVLIAALCYSNTLSAPFAYDDIPALKKIGEGIPKNPLLTLRALPYLTLYMNYRIGGMAVTGYHLFNILVHLLASISVYFLARTILKLKLPEEAFTGWTTCGSMAAFFTALLFVVHPVQTQAVTYIVQRMASMAALFYVLAILLYLQGRIRENAGVRYYPWLIGSFIAALCAVKSKEISLTIPFMALLCEMAFFKSRTRTVVIRIAPFALAALLIPLDVILSGSGQEAGVIQTLGTATAETGIMTRSQYLFTQFRVIAIYLRLLILPINQNLDYATPISFYLSAPKNLLGLALHISLLTTAFCLIIRNRHKYGVDGLLTVTGFGIFWFYLALAVESSIIPIRDVIYEHRLYLPSVGMILAAVSLAAYFMERTRMRQRLIPLLTVGMLSIATLAYSVATYNRNDFWKSGLKLWEDVVEKSPNKARPYLAVGYFKAEAGMNSEAVNYFKKAMELSPGYHDARVGLAAAYLNLGRFDEARVELEKVVKASPGTADAVRLLALTYIKLGRNEEALRVLIDPATRNDKDYDILNITGTVYAQMGNFERAEEYFEKALALKPDTVEIVNNLARLYEKFGHVDKGIRAAKRVLELDSKFHEAANLLGAFYLKKGEWSKAKAEFEKAVALAPDNPKYKKNLEISNTLLIKSIINAKMPTGGPQLDRRLIPQPHQ